MYFRDELEDVSSDKYESSDSEEEFDEESIQSVCGTRRKPYNFRK